MKKFALITLACLFALNSFAQKQIFESPHLKAAIAQHKTVAILPFTVRIRYKTPPKNYDASTNHDQEVETGLKVQSSMFTYLLRKADDYTVTFQDPEETNVILNKTKLIDSLSTHTKAEIAKILGVDAVIFGSYDQETTRSETGAIITAVAFGFGGKTGDGVLTIEIANGTDSELLWRYTKKMDASLFNSSDDVMESQMRKLARNFPYCK